jgi:hypothetical protein
MYSSHPELSLERSREGITLTSAAPAVESSAPCLLSDLAASTGPPCCVDADSSSIKLSRLSRQWIEIGQEEIHGREKGRRQEVEIRLRNQARLE